MTKNPLVSVIIPVYNREHHIQSSIYSVLNQTYKNLEVIVIDDASTDLTGNKVLEITDSRLKYFKNEKNLGPSFSRNRGIKLAAGSLIAFQDSDDEWYPNKLEIQVSLINKSSDDVGAVYCGMEFIDNKTKEKIGEFLKRTDFRKNFTNGPSFSTPSTQTVLIKKCVLDEVGFFDERLFAQEDTELAIRVSKKYRYEFVAESLVKVTRNHQQLMRNAKNYIISREIIYENHKDYLSCKILFKTCKQIANYYILNKDYSKAIKYLVKALNHKFDIKTIFQLTGLVLTPYLIYLFYHKKYNGEIPLTSGVKNFT